MSLRPFQVLEDFLSSYDEPSNDTHEGGASEDGSSSVMFSGGISTDSTTDLTALQEEAPSVQTTATSPTPSVGGDYYDPTVTGLTPGAFIEVYREQLARNAVDADGDNASPNQGFHLHVEDSSSMTSAASEFGGTIVSSQPSGYQVEAAPPKDSSWAMPTETDARPIHRDHASISTTESMFRELASLEGMEEADTVSALSSLQMFMMDDSLVDTDNSDTYSSCTMKSTTQHEESHESENLQLATTATSMTHDRSSFANVGERMALPVVQEEDKGAWFARFTEQDWLNFRRDADMVMTALNLGHLEPSLLPLPPAAPTLPAASIEEAYYASDALPSAFICPLCDDAIVGATTLDCTCPQSTMCLSCWEAYHTNMLEGNSSNRNDSDDDLEELVHVHQNKCCPFCQKVIHHSIACYALDMAILHSIKALPVGDALQRAYYRRLTNWREEVKRRRTESRSKKKEMRDNLLADLIRHEEELFWAAKNNGSEAKIPFWHAHKAQLLLVGELALLIAAAALTGSGAVRGFMARR
jgi:hypothetical protein